MKKTNIEKICEYLETSADFINNLPRYIQSQAKNIPENEIEDFANSVLKTNSEIASLYDAIELHTALVNSRSTLYI